MPRKTPNRQKPVRHFPANLIHKGRSHTAQDLAEIYGIDVSVVYRWHREEGLIAIDDKTPAMFHWETSKQFLTYKNDSRKMATGNAGDLPCLRCYMKRRAYKDKITVKILNEKLWHIQGICFCCGAKMNMRTQANDFLVRVTWGYELVETLPKFSIIGTNTSIATTTPRKGRPKGKFILKNQPKFHPDNERIKHKYFERMARRFDKKTLNKIVSALFVVEEFWGFKDFRLFCYDDSRGFQKYLLEKYSHSMQTAHRTITYVREFFFWLKEHDGYKKLAYDDVDSLQLSLKDRERAKATKPRQYLDAEKVQDIILHIKPENEFEQRGKAMLAFLLSSGIRVDALISLHLGDVNLEQNYIFQDASHVRTKFASSHKTNLWQFKPELKQILADWVKMLRTKYGFTDSDPLFPKMRITTNDSFQFERDGFIKEPIQSTAIVRQELDKLLKNANLGHYTPHSIRHSLVALFLGLGLTGEQEKAISQNMSHKDIGTTRGHYYNMHEFRQDEIIGNLDIEQQLKQKALKSNPKYQFILSQLNNEEAVNKVFEVVSKDC